MAMPREPMARAPPSVGRTWKNHAMAPLPTLHNNTTGQSSVTSFPQRRHCTDMFLSFLFEVLFFLMSN